jgi:hypothetical protein
MIFFPDWADLGLGELSEVTRNSWDNMLLRSETYRRYFDGDIFQEKVEVEGNVADADRPLMYPVGLNLVKMLAIAQADSAFGEYDEFPFRFGVRQDQEPDDADRLAIDVLNDILSGSAAGPTFWQHELERNVYGGSALKVTLSPDSPGHVTWNHVPRGSFFPVWDPTNPDSLLEVYMATSMTAEQAMSKFAYRATQEMVYRVEHWTQFHYNTYMDKQEMPLYSGFNPWGVVPFAYTPRYRFSNWWGDPLTAEVMATQDQLNMTAADIADGINYNAHPTRWGMNLNRDFSSKNFPLGPNAFWNLGRSIGSNPEPKVGILEAKAAVQEGVFSFANFVFDWGMTASSAPPIAFGKDDGGGQRSGVTLEIRMWPLIKAIRRSRTYLYNSIMRAVKITASILRQKRYPDIGVRTIDRMAEGRIVPHFYNIMPRDQQAIVDEVVKLLSTTPPSISAETAQKILGRGSGEVVRIKGMLEDEELWDKPTAEPPPGTLPIENPKDKDQIA